MELFPMPKKAEYGAGSFKLTPDTLIGADKELTDAANLLARRTSEKCGFCPKVLDKKDAEITFSLCKGEAESYEIEIDENHIKIISADKSGACHAAETVCQLLSEDASLPSVKIEDAPYKSFRGVHLYMPGLDYVDEFKRLLDALSMMKMNTVILEISGIMELENHPEINESWVQFCKICVEKFPGGPQNLQWSERYWKDSTHYENGRGQILPKSVVRDIVSYAKSLGMRVIPEIQALSHVYYLTMAHREIAEDVNDIFPDAYCPLNEKSYELYFAVAEEIIEVVQPEIVSIGHDEIRIMGECDKCREKTGAELLAYEICRLHEFYKKHNIRIMMWCEKLLPPIELNGNVWGGGEDSHTDDYGRYWRVPAMYEAIEKLPRDIIMLEWYHSRDENTAKYFAQHGFEVMYGNFSGVVFADWNKRSDYVLGGEVSTWCTPDEKTLGRNGVLFDLLFTANMMWRQDYTDDKYDEIRKTVVQAIPLVRFAFHPEKLSENEIEILYKADGDEAYKIDAKDAEVFGDNAQALLKKCGDMKALSADTAHIKLDKKVYAKSLLFCESFKKAEDFYMSYSFINTAYWDESPSSRVDYLCVDKPRWSAATHEILYADGTVELVNATYGITAADVKLDFTRERITTNDKVSEIDVMSQGQKTKEQVLPQYKTKDNWQNSALYFSDTIFSCGNAAYVYEWQNPHPEKEIVCIKIVSTTHDKNQSALVFAVGYKK